MPAFSNHKEGATITLLVQSRGSRTEILDVSNERVKLRVAAPPVEGAANGEIVTWLSKRLKIPRRDVRILSGERGRQKVILIAGLSAAELEKAMA